MKLVFGSALAEGPTPPKAPSTTAKMASRLFMASFSSRAAGSLGPKPTRGGGRWTIGRSSASGGLGSPAPMLRKAGVRRTLTLALVLALGAGFTAPAEAAKRKHDAITPGAYTTPPIPGAE